MDKNSLTRNMFFNTFGSITYYVCQWLMTILVVRLSGFNDAGLLSLAMTFTSAPAILSVFNVRVYQVSDINNTFSDTAYIYNRLLTCASSIFLCFIATIINRYNFQQFSIINIYMLLRIIEGIADVYHGIDQKNERMDYVGISLGLRGIGSIIIFVVGWFITKSLFLVILMIDIFSIIFVLVYDRTVTSKLIPISQQLNSIKIDVFKIIQICWPLAIVSFLNNLSISIPKLYLQKYYGEEILGIYSSIATPTIIIQLAATTIFAPLVLPLTKAFSENDHKTFINIIKKFILLLFAFLIVAIIFSLLFADAILILIFGSEIASYTHLFIPIIVISLLIALNLSLFSICTLVRVIKKQLIIGIIGILVAFILSITLIKHYSMNGVIMNLAVTLILQILIQLFLILCAFKERSK